MTTPTALLLRRLVLLGAPLVLIVLMIVHQMISQLTQPDGFMSLHLVLLPMFGLAGVAGWLLTEGRKGAIAWVSRAAFFGFIVFYGGYDAVAGVAASDLISQSLRAADPAASESLMNAARALWASSPIMLQIGVYSWFVAVLAAVVVLFRESKPIIPLLILVPSAVLLDNNHGGLEGVVVFGCFLVGAAWLELRSPAPIVAERQPDISAAS